MNVKQIVIDELLKEMENGSTAWTSPYFSGSSKRGFKRNFFSSHIYRGMNSLLLASSPDKYFMTFKQAAEIGHVKKGASSKIVIFWKVYEKDVHGEKKNVPVLNYYRVFGLSQIDITNEEKYKSVLAKREAEEAEELEHNPVIDIEEFINLTKFKVVHNNNSMAYYSPAQDYINIPEMRTFKTPDMYYSIMFHEAGHMCGAPKRLNRFEVMTIHKKSEEYSQEELTAEISSCILSAEFNINVNYKNSAAYINGWKQYIKDNQNAFFKSVKQAEECVDYLQELVNKNRSEQPAAVNPEPVIIPEPEAAEPAAVEVIAEPAAVEPVAVKAPVKTTDKILNVAMFKKYITVNTLQIEVSRDTVKYININKTVVVYNVNVDTDQSYNIAVNPIRKELKSIKGQILFRDKKIITDSIIVPFEPEVSIMLPVSIPTDYYNTGLVNAVSKVIHAADDCTIKPVFHAVCFSDNKIIATDSRRLSLTDFTLDIADEIIIDRYVMDTAIKDKLDYISIVSDDNNVRYAVVTNKQDITVIAQEVDGKFPEWKRIMPCPESIKQGLNIDTDIISKFIAYKQGIVIFDGNTLTHKQTGQSITIPAEFKNPIAFNPEFLKDCLKGHINILLSDITRPSLFTDGLVTDLIMPIQAA